MYRPSEFPFKEEIYSYLGNSKTPILSALSGISFPDPAYEITRKNSMAYSVEYIYEGEGVIQENGKMYKVTQGDFFILHPNSYHHYYSSPKNPWKKIWFLIDGDTSYLSYLLDMYKIRDIVHFPKIYMPLELEKIFDLLKKDSNDISKDLEHLIYLLIQNLAHIIHNRPKHENTLSRAKFFIDRKIKTRLTVKEVSDYLSVSTVYLSRAFKDEYGISPNKYILEKKIEFAKTLLKKTPLSIEQISQELAFFDVSHFSHTFKKISGYTPSEFRENFI